LGKKKYEILRCEVKPEEFEDMFLYFYDISPNGVYVDCNSRGLDSIPTDLPNNTYNL
jgi:hypothetical protein